jgi:hypothetical protein
MTLINPDKSDIDIDRKLIVAIGGTIAKSVLYISLTVCLCFGLSKCSLDSKTIAQCEIACQKSNGIREVSIYSCRCNNPDSGEIWVAPVK